MQTQSNLILPAEKKLVRSVRARVRDNAMTYDGAGRMAVDRIAGREFLVNPGAMLAQPAIMRDGRTYDSTGAFLVGELERLDLTLHEPLAAVTWGRDIDLREDVTIADEISSFTLTTYASAGGLGAGNSIGNGKAWIGKTSDQIGGVGVDIAKIAKQLQLWGLELKYTIPELESSARVGRPIDQQKFDALQLKYQMDVDEQVYIGDTSTGATGLFNDANVTPSSVANGAAGSPLWTTKTPDEILTDFNTWLITVWTQSGYAVLPNRVLLPPTQFGYLATQKVSLAGNVSLLKYILENNIVATQQGAKIDILPVKWAVGAGAGGTVGTANGKDRAVVYNKDYKRVRFPLTLLQRTPIQFESIYHKTTYFGRLGALELVYPETVGYFDGF